MVDISPGANEVDLPLRHERRRVEQVHRPGTEVLPHNFGLLELDRVGLKGPLCVVLAEVPLGGALQERCYGRWDVQLLLRDFIGFKHGAAALATAALRVAVVMVLLRVEVGVSLLVARCLGLVVPNAAVVEVDRVKPPARL